MVESATRTRTITEVGSDPKAVTPRAVIDTSPPFGSVEEAVTHFGGRGSWIPHHLLRLPPHHDMKEFDIERVEERAAELEKDLLVKEQETLDVLKELDDAKRFVEILKLNLLKEVSECVTTPNSNPESQLSTPKDKSMDGLSLCPAPSPGLILMELNQAKLNFNKTTDDLAAIRASVDSLNRKMQKEKNLLEKTEEKQILKNAGDFSVEERLERARVKLQIANEDQEKKVYPRISANMSRELRQLNFEAEQFRVIADAARYEIIKATTEIEQTKTSINMVEMRLIAAKKMEEAARAVEAVAIAEVKARSNCENSSGVFQQRPQGITISYEEYTVLLQKAQKAEEILRKKAFDSRPHIDDSNAPKMATQQNFGETVKGTKHRKKSLGERLGHVDGGDRGKLVADGSFCRDIPEHNSTNFKFKNSYPSYGDRDSQSPNENEETLLKDDSMPVFRSTISIGDILGRKLILQDDVVVEKEEESHTGRQQVSLSQMLREQSGLIFSSSKAAKDESVRRQFFGQRKKFGFIHVSLPLTKQSKKKVHTF